MGTTGSARPRRGGTLAVLALLAMACSPTPPPTSTPGQEPTGRLAPAVDAHVDAGVRQERDHPRPAASGEEGEPRTTRLSSGRQAGDLAAWIEAALWAAPDLHGAVAPVAVVPVAIDAPGPGAVVVTLVEVGHDGPVARVQVALVDGPDGIAIAGSVRLPVADGPGEAALDLVPLDDPDLAELARRALDRAGVTAPLTALSQALHAWPLIAHVVVDGAPTQVWLRRHGKDLVVAGTEPATTEGAAP